MPTVSADDELVREAMAASGITGEREVVEEALRVLIRLKAQEEALRYRGKLPWDGDIEASRLG